MTDQKVAIANANLNSRRIRQAVSDEIFDSEEVQKKIVIPMARVVEICRGLMRGKQKA